MTSKDLADFQAITAHLTDREKKLVQNFINIMLLILMNSGD